MPIGAAIGISGVAGAAANIYAGGQQASAAGRAADMQKAQYDQTRSDLMPFQQAGQTGTNMLMQQLPALSAPIELDEATLRNTPGYQFNLNQGEKSVANSAAARGLGSSGAALKGAATYASGLADSTYQNQFNNLLMSRQNTYNQLMGTAQLGENAAAKTGDIGTTTTTNAGNALLGGAAAQGAAATGAANALTGGVNTDLGYNLAQQQIAANAAKPAASPTLGLYSGTGLGTLTSNGFIYN